MSSRAAKSHRTAAAARRRTHRRPHSAVHCRCYHRYWCWCRCCWHWRGCWRRNPAPAPGRETTRTSARAPSPAGVSTSATVRGVDDGVVVIDDWDNSDDLQGHPRAVCAVGTHPVHLTTILMMEAVAGDFVHNAAAAVGGVRPTAPAVAAAVDTAHDDDCSASASAAAVAAGSVHHHYYSRRSSGYARLEGSCCTTAESRSSQPREGYSLTSRTKPSLHGVRPRTVFQREKKG